MHEEAFWDWLLLNDEEGYKAARLDKASEDHYYATWARQGKPGLTPSAQTATTPTSQEKVTPSGVKGSALSDRYGYLVNNVAPWLQYRMTYEGLGREQAQEIMNLIWEDLYTPKETDAQRAKREAETSAYYIELKKAQDRGQKVMPPMPKSMLAQPQIQPVSESKYFTNVTNWMADQTVAAGKTYQGKVQQAQQALGQRLPPDDPYWSLSPEEQATQAAKWAGLTPPAPSTLTRAITPEEAQVMGRPDLVGTTYQVSLGSALADAEQAKAQEGMYAQRTATALTQANQQNFNAQKQWDKEHFYDVPVQMSRAQAEYEKTLSATSPYWDMTPAEQQKDVGFTPTSAAQLQQQNQVQGQYDYLTGILGGRVKVPSVQTPTTTGAYQSALSGLNAPVARFFANQGSDIYADFDTKHPGARDAWQTALDRGTAYRQAIGTGGFSMGANIQAPDMPSLSADPWAAYLKTVPFLSTYLAASPSQRGFNQSRTAPRTGMIRY